MRNRAKILLWLTHCPSFCSCRSVSCMQTLVLWRLLDSAVFYRPIFSKHVLPRRRIPARMSLHPRFYSRTGEGNWFSKVCLRFKWLCFGFYCPVSIFSLKKNFLSPRGCPHPRERADGGKPRKENQLYCLWMENTRSKPQARKERQARVFFLPYCYTHFLTFC